VGEGASRAVGALSDWDRFASLPAERLHAVRDRMLTRYVRDELWPFARSARRRLEAAGLSPARIRGLADLAAVRPLTLAELARAQREPDERSEHRLVPDPAELRRSGGFGRRLALRLGGPRVSKLLAHAYATIFELDGPDGLRMAWTPHDVEVAAESGARALAILGLARRRDRTLLLEPDEHRTAALALHHGAIQAGARVELAEREREAAHVERLRPTGLVGTARALRQVLAAAPAGLERVERCVLLGLDDRPDERRAVLAAARRAATADVALGRLWAPSWGRMAFAGPAGPEVEIAVHVHPDLGAFERVDDRDAGASLVYTATSGHGAAILRLATGRTVTAVEAPPPAGTVGFPLLTFPSPG